MKRAFTLIVFFTALCAVAISQTQLENPGFEEWEDILTSETDTIREPIDWSSLKTSDVPSLITLAPDVLKRSSDAHSGAYAVQLTNVESFIVANGVATNGRMHPDVVTANAYIYTDPEDGQWNTPFTGRPDSIAGWIKYSPQEGDNIQIQAILHKGYGKRPDPDQAENWIGEAVFETPQDTEGEWIRFSTHFTYSHESTPEFILMVLNSGNGFSPVAGSVLLLDDLEMIYNSPQSALNRLKQTEGYIYALGKQQLILKGMDHTLFQSIEVFDVSGKLLWSARLTSDQVDITPAHFNNGLFVVKLSGKQNIYTQKVLLH